MKSFLKPFILILILASCKEDQTEPEFIDSNKIEINEIVHDELTQEQLNNIKKIHSTFQEVDKISLEQTIEDFKRDLHPDNEIKIWLQMAEAYQSYLDYKNGDIDLNTKTEVYKLILSRSMMSDEQAIQNSDLKLLSKKDALKVLSFYKAKPDPIDVIEK